MKRLMNTKNTAEYLDTCEGTLRYWRKIGAGPPYVKLEGSVRYDVADLDAYIEKQKTFSSVTEICGG